MSQLAPVRPLPRTSPRRAAPAPRQLKVVAPPQVQGNGLFLALCVALLLGGLRRRAHAQHRDGQGLVHDARPPAPLRPARRHPGRPAAHHRRRSPVPARWRNGPGHSGMVPAATPAFLRLSDGKVLGVAKKAKDDSTFSVVTEPKAPTRSTPVATVPPAGRGRDGHDRRDEEVDHQAHQEARPRRSPPRRRTPRAPRPTRRPRTDRRARRTTDTTPTERAVTQRRTPPPSGRARPASAPAGTPRAPRPRDGSTPKPTGAKATSSARAPRPRPVHPERGAPGCGSRRGTASLGRHGRSRPLHLGRPVPSNKPGPPTTHQPGARSPRRRRLGAAPHGRARGFARRQPAPPDALPHRRLPVRAQHLRRAARAHPGLRRDRGRAGGAAQARGGPDHPRDAWPGARLRRHRARLERRARGGRGRPDGGVHLRHRQDHLRLRHVGGCRSAGCHQAGAPARHHRLRARLRPHRHQPVQGAQP